MVERLRYDPTRLTFTMERILPEKPQWRPCPRPPQPEPGFACFAWTSSARTRVCALAALSPAPSRPFPATPWNRPESTTARRGTYAHLNIQFGPDVRPDAIDETREQEKRVETVVVYLLLWAWVAYWHGSSLSHNCRRSISRSGCAHLLKLSVLNDTAFVRIDLVEQLLRLYLGESALGDNLGSFLPAVSERGCGADRDIQTQHETIGIRKPRGTTQLYTYPSLLLRKHPPLIPGNCFGVRSTLTGCCH